MRHEVDLKIESYLGTIGECERQRDSFYSSRRWTETSRIVVTRDCGIDVWHWIKTGELIPGNHVHHIIPVMENWDRRFDVSNLVTVSAKSHGEIGKLYTLSDESKLYVQDMLADAVKNLRYLFDVYSSGAAVTLKQHVGGGVA